MKIYLSQSNDIYFNLALENWLFLENLRNEKILFLWQNSPCVVIGRAQNPWLECNLNAMNKDKISVVRRQSGGGTVYHDYGNLNYTIISTKKDHDVKANLELVCSVVNKIGFMLYPNERNDIMISHNNSSYKVSGSAFREKKDRAFQHGTLLINTDMSKLYNYLHHPIDKSLDTKGVKSYRSKVLNLANIKDIEIQDIKTSFLLNLPSTELNLIGEETPLKNKELIIREIKNLQSWEWCFAKTLPFTKIYSNGKNDLKVQIQSGMVTNLIYRNKELNIKCRNIKFKYNYEFSFFKKFL